MSEDQRLYPRFDYVCPAQCSFLESFPESFPIGITDIAPEGFGFLCEQQLNRGVKLIITIDLGLESPVKFLTKVQWSQSVANSNKFKIGVKIFDASNEDLEAFISFYYRGLIPGQGRKKKILIIKKDKKRAKHLQSELAKYHHDVNCAFSGEDGFSQYTREHPDLILLDMNIAQMSAFEFCRKVRKLQGDDQVIIFAMLAGKKDKSEIESWDIGIQKYYLASLSDERLISVINDALITCSNKDTQ